MTVAGMVKSSFVDYPGLISCVLFLPGCNYNCFYCHNRPLLESGYKKVELDYIDEFLNSRRDMLDAVVITGGEPTIQPDLIPFMRKIRDKGFKLKLDTNGSAPDVVLEVLRAGLADYFAVDYKAPTARYSEVAGGKAGSQTVLQTISLLLESRAKFEVRTTVIPQLDTHDLLQMARELPIVPRYVLNRYRKPDMYLTCDEERVNQTPYSRNRLEALADTIREYQPNVVV